MAKLTEAQVLEIRRRYVPYRVGYNKLAKEFGVSADMVQRIVLRQNWTHI